MGPQKEGLEVHVRGAGEDGRGKKKERGEFPPKRVERTLVSMISKRGRGR